MKRILLLVSGMSPQIITETLYSLITQKKPWMPDEIHLITTLQGKDNAVLQLLTGKKIFEKLLFDYKVSHKIRFNEDTMHLIHFKGKPIADLLTPEHNQAAADSIIEVIRQFTLDDQSELHVSLAGGRKTMGFYAGYALSMLGRPQDRLSHVLVSENYESNRNFYYPTPYSQEVITRDGKSLDAKHAEVWLADIPFVRLRSFLPVDFLSHEATFMEVVNRIDILAGAPCLVVNISESILEVGAIQIRLTNIQLAFYLLFIEYKHTKRDFILTKREPNAEATKEFLEILKVIKSDIGLDHTMRALRKGMTREFFDYNKSRLNKEIEKVLGKSGAERYQIKTGPRGSGLFYLGMDMSEIKVKE